MKGVENKILVLPIIVALLLLFAFTSFVSGTHIFSGTGYGITGRNGTTTITNHSNSTFNGIVLNVSANETINMSGGGFAFEWINQSGTGTNITAGITVVNNNGTTSGNYTYIAILNLQNGTHIFRFVGWQ